MQEESQVMQRLSQPCPTAASCTGGSRHLSCHHPSPPGGLALSPELTLSRGLLLSQPGCGVTLGDRLFPIVCWGGNSPVPSPSQDQPDPARKRLPKCLCSPCDGAAPSAVYSPLICLFPGPAGHNRALSGPRCPVSSPGPTRCRSGGLLWASAGTMSSGRTEPPQQ